MEELRKFTQHRSIPLEQLSNSISRQPQGVRSDPEAFWIKKTIDPKVRIRTLIMDPKINSQTKRELRDLTERGVEHICLKFLARSYIAQLAECHEYFRKHTEGFSEQVLSVHDKALQRLRAKTQERVVEPILLFRDDKGSPAKSDLGTELSDGLLASRENWKGLKYVTRSYVSSEVVFDRKSYPQEEQFRQHSVEPNFKNDIIP